MELRVSFRGKDLRVEGLEGTTPLSSLKEKLQELTTVPTANQKLILKGKTLRDDADTLEQAGVVSPTATAAGGGGGEGERFIQKSRLMLVGSTSAEVKVVLTGRDPVSTRNDLQGAVIPNGYRRVALNPPAGPSEFSRYRFEKIKTLPGLPNEDTARELLEELAADPGVRAVLDKHRWTVGALCELYPEGQVGVTGKVIMGLNQNHGQKILLRLRTDDLQGFRKILSIRKVLFHELAHNDISPHNDEFYMLMRQVEQEAEELNWTRQYGRTAAGGPRTLRALPALVPGSGGGYILVKEAFEGGSGRLGGDSNALQHLYSARELAGQAAVRRLSPEEQEVEDCCGHTGGVENATMAATAATPSGTAGADESAETSPAVAIGADGGEVGTLTLGGEGDEVGEAAAGGRGRGVSQAATERLILNTRSGLVPGVCDGLGVSDMDVAAEDGLAGTADESEARSTVLSKADRPSGEIRGGEEGAAAVAGQAIVIEERPKEAETAQVDVTESEYSGMVGSQQQQVITAVANASTVVSTTANQDGFVIDTALEPAPTTAPTPSHPQRSTAPVPPSQPSPVLVDELFAMGFPRDDAIMALSASGGSLPDAAYRLITPGVVRSTGGVADGEQERQVAGSGAGGSTGEEVHLPRDVRLQKEAELVASLGDRARAVQCLQTLAAMFRNILEHPGEEKFRKVRRSNAKFKASVGSVPGGVEVLLAAGFEDRGTDQWQLGRQDPGLIWLAKSTVEAYQENLEAAGGV